MYDGMCLKYLKQWFVALNNLILFSFCLSGRSGHPIYPQIVQYYTRHPATPQDQCEKPRAAFVSILFHTSIHAFFLQKTPLYLGSWWLRFNSVARLLCFEEEKINFKVRIRVSAYVLLSNNYSGMEFSP